MAEKKAKAATIKIKYATINDNPVIKNVRKGATLSELAEDLDISVQVLRVNGDRQPGGYVIKADDFVVAIDTEVAGA